MMGPQWTNGPTPGKLYDFPGYNSSDYDVLTTYQHGSQRSGSMITTGTSVVGLVYDNGVIIAADTLVSYGGLARFPNQARVHKINDKVIWGCSGDFADYQNIKCFIQQKIINETALDDNTTIEPRALYNYLSTYLYRKRSDMKPLFVDIVVGGLQKVVNSNPVEYIPFLANVNVRGKAFEDNIIATGFGTHLALPLLRNAELPFRKLTNSELKDNPEKQYIMETSEQIRLSKEEAEDLYKQKGGAKPNVLLSRAEAEDVIEKAMRVLYYRDCRAFSRFNKIICEKGANGEPQVSNVLPAEVQSNWDVAKLTIGF